MAYAVTLNVRVDSEAKEAFEICARMAGKSLSDWARDVLLQAVVKMDRDEAVSAREARRAIRRLTTTPSPLPEEELPPVIKVVTPSSGKWVCGCGRANFSDRCPACGTKRK